MTPVEPRVAPHGTELGSRRTPYQGLVPYSEDDADYFFGRTVWREVVTDHLLAYRLTLLYGPSGVGKSSVLGAGVIHELHKLAKQNLELTGRPEFLPVIVSQWSGDPMVAVQEAVGLAGTRLWPAMPLEPVTGSLRELVSSWADRVDRILLVLDQFDEFFMYHEAKPHGLDLVDRLTELIADREVPLNVLIAIREDALAKLDRLENTSFDLWQNLLRIDHLDADAAREAIEKPIERWNERGAAEGEHITLGPGLVDAVIAEADARTVLIGSAGRGVVDVAEPELGGKRVEAPYLQLVMTRLWEEERLRGSSVLQLETLNRMGGAQQIVRAHFDVVMHELSRRQRGRAARMLQYLVTPAGTKIALPPSALAKWSKQDEKDIVPILATLASGRQRILRTVSSPGDTSGATNYEIFHDRLAGGILDWQRRYSRHRWMLRASAVMVGVFVVASVLVAGTIYRQHERNRALEACLRRAEASRQTPGLQTPGLQTPGMRADYEKLFASATIRPERVQAVDRVIDTIVSHRTRYQRIQDETRVPWQVVGMIHYIEAAFDFSRHLSNGDPLTARTVNVPAGRPVNGDPPFTWEQSATDYMRYLNLADTPWNVADTLYAIERVNGMGYRQHHVPSPYLWAGSNHYTRGKFVGDGIFSPTAVSQQIGLAVLLRRMVDRRLLAVGARGIFSFCIDSGR